MATRTVEDIRRDLEAERAALVASVDRLRRETSLAVDVGARVRGRLPLLVPAAFAASFVLAGGVGATMRYAARRGRER